MKKKQMSSPKLSNEETLTFLNKYEKIILIESKKRSRLTGIGIEDLMQECRKKLITGYKSFDSNKSSEKTWASHVIRNTLDGIWNRSIKKKRVNMLPNEEGVLEPNRDICLSNENEYFLKINDSHPIFGTVIFEPDEYLRVLEALSYLKVNLPEESYKLIKEELFPELEENIPTVIRKTNYRIKKKSEYEIWSVFANISEHRARILNQIADFFINVLGFKKEEILGRQNTTDLVNLM
jgi:DNA-directed RNA polymerase specialized sigma24 family protein